MIKMPTGKYAVIRGVPHTYDRCIKSHKVENEIKVELAQGQHIRYCEILEQLGLTLIFIDPDDRFPSTSSHLPLRLWVSSNTGENQAHIAS